MHLTLQCCCARRVLTELRFCTGWAGGRGSAVSRHVAAHGDLCGVTVTFTSRCAKPRCCHERLSLG